MRCIDNYSESQVNDSITFVRLKHASMLCLASGTGSTKVRKGGGGGA